MCGVPGGIAQREPESHALDKLPTTDPEIAGEVCLCGTCIVVQGGSR